MSTIFDLESPTDAASSQGTSSQQRTFLNLSKEGDQRLAGFEVQNSPSGVREPQIRITKRPPPAVQTRTAQPRTSLGVKFLLQKAHQLACNMYEHASAAEPMSLANKGFELIDALDELWRHREAREPDWGDIANLLRTSLTRIEFEKLRPEQCRLVGRVIDECLDSGRTDATDLQRALRLIREAELNPWKVLAQSKT